MYFATPLTYIQSVEVEEADVKGFFRLKLLDAQKKEIGAVIAHRQAMEKIKTDIENILE